jgi:tyrosyl-tRNA synthetase
VGGGTQSQPDKSKAGLTLPQVIALVDSRLSKLEQQAKTGESKKTSVESQVDMESLKPILEEYDHRFTMLATQVSELKEIVLKLQSYTMDVNKTLLDERIQFMNETTEETLKDFNVGSDTIKLDDLVLEDPAVVSSFDQAITEELADQEASEIAEAAIPVDNETATDE